MSSACAVSHANIRREASLLQSSLQRRIEICGLHGGRERSSLGTVFALYLVTLYSKIFTDSRSFSSVRSMYFMGG